MVDGPWTVADLNGHIRDLLQSEDTLRDIWVQGEVSNIFRAKSGHVYFTIKDNQSQLSCVMWSSNAQRQTFQPQTGDVLLAHGSIDVYTPRGEYQLVADKLRQAGTVGDLWREFEELKARLDAEGLFDPERKRELPVFPRRMGIVTSPDAAAFQDVQNVLRRRFPLVELVLSPTLVQGFEAPRQIVQALERLYADNSLDVILICRGGGSIEDLWAFNDEAVARTLAASPKPTVSGVGHETDFTIVDFVADVRAPTPSAAAEVATPNIADLIAMTAVVGENLTRYAQGIIADRRLQLNNTTRTLRRLSPERRIVELRQRVDERSLRMERAQLRYLALLRERLQNRAAALRSASPQAVLERGYAIVRRSDDGRMIRQRSDAPPGTAIEIQTARDTISARTEDEETHGRYSKTLF